MSPRQAKRVYLELTAKQRVQIAAVREKIENEEKAEILSQAKRLRNARRRGIAALQESIQLLKTERKAQGLSLSDVEHRTGIAKSNLSKLENAEEGNPTIATLASYAEALGKKLMICLVDK